MNKPVYLIVLLIVLSGCATIGSINGNYAKINCSDGINANEAGLIAKHDLIQTDLKYYYNIIHPRVVGGTPQWMVTFYEKGWLHFFPESYDIYIDGKTGEIYQRCKCLGFSFGDPCRCEVSK